MQGAKRVIFIIGSTVAATPAVLAGFAGVVGMFVIIAVATLLCMALGVAIAICCLPIIVWCAFFEISNSEAIKKRIQDRVTESELN